MKFLFLVFILFCDSIDHDLIQCTLAPVDSEASYTQVDSFEVDIECTNTADFEVCFHEGLTPFREDNGMMGTKTFVYESGYGEYTGLMIMPMFETFSEENLICLEAGSSTSARLDMTKSECIDTSKGTTITVKVEITFLIGKIGDTTATCAQFEKLTNTISFEVTGENMCSDRRSSMKRKAYSAGTYNDWAACNYLNYPQWHEGQEANDNWVEIYDCTDEEIQKVKDATWTVDAICEHIRECKNSLNTFGEWFGSSSRYSIDQIYNDFAKICTMASWKIRCFRGPNIYAFVRPSLTEDHTVYLHETNYFTAKDVSRHCTDTRAGILIHELSHFDDIASTDDHVYGVSRCLNLAKNNHVYAMNNADNLEYFFEHFWENGRCQKTEKSKLEKAKNASIDKDSQEGLVISDTTAFVLLGIVACLFCMLFWTWCCKLCKKKETNEDGGYIEHILLEEENESTLI